MDLKRPIYKKTASGGHFGRSDPDFTWEKFVDLSHEKKKKEEKKEWFILYVWTLILKDLN